MQPLKSKYQSELHFTWRLPSDLTVSQGMTVTPINFVTSQAPQKRNGAGESCAMWCSAAYAVVKINRVKAINGRECMSLQIIVAICLRLSS